MAAEAAQKAVPRRCVAAVAVEKMGVENRYPIRIPIGPHTIDILIDMLMFFW
jgi:hypothetical protein